MQLKERQYYEDLKKRIGKYNEAWKTISGRPFVGNCSYLWSKLKPKSYQDFFDKYTTYLDPCSVPGRLKKNEFYGRSIKDLERLALQYKTRAHDDGEFTVEDYLDDIICHVIIETFDGHKPERELVKILEENGFEVEETEGVMDAEFGVDLIVKKDGEIKEYIQVKPISTFLGTKNHSLKNDRANFFQKQYLLDEFVKNHPYLPKRNIIFMIYDYYHLKETGEVRWCYKDGKVKFKLNELCQTNGETLIKYSDFTSQKLVLKH